MNKDGIIYWAVMLTLLIACFIGGACLAIKDAQNASTDIESNVTDKIVRGHIIKKFIGTPIYM